jgi:PAS domain S-box-containing protein
MSREHPARIKSSVMDSMVWFIGLVVFLFPQGAPVKAAAAPKRILALYWYNKDFPSNAPFDQSLQAVLKSAPAGSIEYYTEYLESDRFPGENQSKALRDYLRQKYASRFIDVVVAVSDVPLDFLLKYRDSLFTKTPIVFIAIKRPATNETSGPGLTGIVLGGGYKKTLDLALRLHTGTKQVFIISGTLNHDKTYETLCQEELQGLDSGISINYFTDLSVDELIFKTKHLPERSVVLYIWEQSQNEGRLLESADILAAIAPSTTAPIYGVANWQVGRGVVGGYLRTFESDGTRVGEIALRIANGARAQNIPIESATKAPIFDWGQLHRWGLKESALPPGSVVLNRQTTVWESIKWYILGATSLLCLQALIIGALMWQRAGRKKAETEMVLSNNRLRESEERFRLVANTAPVLIWMSGPDKLRSYCNQPWLEFTGRPIEAELGNGWAKGVHSEDLRGCMDTYTNAFDRRESFKMQYRLRRSDGEYRWVFDIGVPRFDLHGSFVGYIGSCNDVTEHKRAEEALASLSGRLIDAQEEERKRIARELHDDYNQRLAMLALDLENLAENIGDSSVDAAHQLLESYERVSELGADLHSLSHRLHSSTLESLGLVAGVKAFCKEFEEQQGIQVDFAHENVPHDIPEDAALCIFRIAQEGLRNIKRHSGADRAEVRLEGLEETLHLSVTDPGRGFDVNKRSPQNGIGIRSMKERLRNLGGHLEVRSRQMAGTRIDAWLPFNAASRLAS